MKVFSLQHSKLFFKVLLSSFILAAGHVNAVALTALTDGIWAEYVQARSNAQLIGTGLAAGGGLYSAITGKAWVLDKAKVPGTLNSMLPLWVGCLKMRYAAIF